MSKYAGSGWIATQKYGKAMSPLGIAAADLLGDVFEGIYHLNERALAKVRWENPHQVEVILSDSQRFSTVDHNVLTRIVVLAHDRAMRVTIRGVAPGYLRLLFHQRTREGDLYTSCPTMEDHIAAIRQRFGEPTL